MSEAQLYAPVKAFFEGLGYAVKGEIAGCDLVATSLEAPEHVVVCELKVSFSLELVLQAVERAALADEVWLAAPMSRSGRGRSLDTRFRQLCRRLGFGALAVSPNGDVAILVSADAPTPRRNPRRRSLVMTEYRRRAGDPTPGGSSKLPVMTAYRQGALACVAALADGPKRPRDLRPLVPTAASMLRRNVYGWFYRVDRGLYGLTEAGHAALQRWPHLPAGRAPEMSPESVAPAIVL
jgi:hypothetical protein